MTMNDGIIIVVSLSELLDGLSFLWGMHTRYRLTSRSQIFAGVRFR